MIICNKNIFLKPLGRNLHLTNFWRSTYLTLFSSLFLFCGNVNAGGGINGNLLNIKYNKCTGAIEAKFHVFRDPDGCSDADRVVTVDLYYKNNSDIWIKYYKHHRGGTSEHTYYGGVVEISNSELWSGKDAYRVVAVSNMPSDMKYPAEFKLKYRWLKDACQSEEYEDDSDNLTYGPFTYQTIDAPTSLTATKVNCQQVVLNWNNPSQLWENNNICGNYGTYEHLIYKNNQHLTTVTKTTNTYTVTGLSHGASDSYQIKTRWIPYGNGYFSILSNGSNSDIGSTKPVFEAPVLISATNDRCDGKIMLNWDYSGSEAPASFSIQYGLGDNLTDSIHGIFASARSYLFDPGPNNLNLQFGFKIKNINSCNASSQYSSTLTGLAEGTLIPDTIVGCFFDSINQKVVVSWKNPTKNEFPTKSFKISRIEPGKSNVDFEISKSEAIYNETTKVYSFFDDNISNCVTYRYQVRPISACAPGGVYNSTVSQSAPISISQNIRASMASVKASKGYYSDRVTLTWNTDQKVALTAYEIWRKIATSNIDSVKIATVQGGTEEYTDLSAVAGFLYQYTIRGKLNCVGLIPDYTNAITDIGFKSPSGSVSGRVTYTGGYSSNNIKITVERTNSSLSNPDGYSMYFNGTNQNIVVPQTKSFDIRNDFSIECWIKPNSLNSNFTILKKGNPTQDSGIWVHYTSSDNKLNVETRIGTTIETISIDTPFADTSNFRHLGITRLNDTLYVTINGKARKFKNVSTGNLKLSSQPLYIGSADSSGYFNGYIDDLRIWNIGKDTLIMSRDYGRIVSPTSNGLMLYYPFDENISGHSKVYDQAFDYNSQQARENHGTINNGATWSNRVPGSSNLACIDYTDLNGYYTVSNIRYTGTGETFRVVPSYETHRFGPSLRNLFLGESSSVHNGIDFIDSSSFIFRGRVLYGEDLENTAKMYNPSPQVHVYIDGNMAVQNMIPVTSNAQGEFEIRVPIGEHTISVKKDNHLFLNNGNWPINAAKHNFQSDINERANFIDTTKIKLTGRIVGGPLEFNKPYGLNAKKSKNNIGIARISLKTTGANSKSYDSVYTDLLTGTYEVMVYPLFYNFGAVIINNNQNITLGPYPSLNLTTTNVFDSIKFYDTTYYTGLNCDPCYYLSDSSWFNFIYPKTAFRSTPKLFISKKSNPKFDFFMGDDSIRVASNRQVGVLSTNGNFNFNYPIFQQGRLYSLYMYGYEEYRNHDDDDKTDTSFVPYQGFVQINNNLKETNSVEQIELDAEGKYTYRFICGPPNISLTKDDNLSFTKNFEAILFPDKTFNFGTSWKNGGQRAIVIGNAPKSGGLDFFTVGPTNIDFIVRRPPGSSSIASVAKSTSYSRQTSFAKLYEDDFYIGLVKNIGASLTMSSPVAIGGLLNIGTVSNSTNIEAGINQTANLKKGDYEIKTYTTNFEVQTQPISGLAADLAGTGDVYVGRSNNYRFSEIYEVKLVSTPSCRNNPNVNCPLSDSAENYSLARVSTIGYDNAGINTSFAYSEYEIINNVIPLLERRRNELFITDSTKYRSKIPADHPLYGCNNDDPIWGDSLRTPTNRITTEAADTSGPSYVCSTRGKNQDSTYASWDEIRNYNQQIRLWKEAVAKNEALKYKININRNAYRSIDNISFDSRSKYTKSYTVDNSKTDYQEWEVMASFIGNLAKEDLVNGAGIGFKTNTSQGGGQAQDSSSTNTNTTTWSFAFEDNDLNDRFSIDVYDPQDGGSPIFVNKGGRSRCPNEGPSYAKFYNPNVDFVSSHTNNSNALLSDGTIKIEAPKIEVIGASIKENIPASNSANFTIRLKNDANYELDYELKVDQSTNPDGAIIKIDGLDPNRSYNLDSQDVITKVVTIERGPEKYIYDNIKLVFKSPCQDDIADEIFLSARFTPTCTDVDLKEPTNNWVVNTNSNNTLPVELENYDINFSYFNNLSLLYKSKASDSWIPIHQFNKNAEQGTENYIPRDKATINYNWDSLNMLPDGTYEIKAVSSCWLDSVGFNVVKVNSVSKEGILDLTRPRVFGTPSPGDGILSPNDDISIQFTEPVDNSALRFDNFQVKGIPNTAPIRHNATLYFDGVDDRAEIMTAPNLAQKSFSISFWALVKRQNQKQVFISQGTDNNLIEVGLNAANRFYATIGNSTVIADDNLIKGGKSLSPVYSDTTELNFFGVSYNAETETIILLINNEKVNSNTNFTTNYTSSGKINIGCDVNNSSQFKGNFTDLRMWSRALAITELQLNINSRTSISQAGLLHNWELNEGTDSILTDKIRKREMRVIGATWNLFNHGYALKSDLSGDAILSINSGTYPITNNMDMTLEFWFKTSQTNSEQVILSTGNPEYNNPMGYHEPYWQIKMKESGQIQIGYRGNSSDSILVNNTAYNDDNWHHFAMVLSRTSNLTTYIDGKQQNTLIASNVPTFASSAITLCGLKTSESPASNTSIHVKRFIGNIDEFRLWDLARTNEQIINEKNTRLSGKELGLKCYLPFEKYKNNAGIQLIDSTIENIVDSSFALITSKNQGLYVTNTTPVIKLNEPYANFDLTYLTNNDKIIIIPEASPAAIENVTLNITTSNVQDRYGNKLASPKTWIAYVDKNQVKWDGHEFSFEKKSGQVLTFTNEILNSGGETKQWSIGNLPPWLTASPSSGVISPNTSKLITFTIDPTVNIGKYDIDLQLITNFGYYDKMYLKLKVYALPPASWSVNPSLYSGNMNIIAQLKIDNTFSTNPDDIIAVFKGSDCRGTAHLQYYPQIDKYIAYLSVLSNNEAGIENLTYKIWNATEGKIHSLVEPSDSTCLIYEPNAIKGSFVTPVLFNASDKLTREIILNPGWNWISFNLTMPNYHLNPFNGMQGILSNLKQPTSGDLIRVQGIFGPDTNISVQRFAAYNSFGGWVGELNKVDVVNGYRYNASRQDTITIVGSEVDPTTNPIRVLPGWNWIGFPSQRNLNTATALGNYNAQNGDILKSQTQFSMYVNNIGWVGTLNALIPNKSYMLFSSNNNQTEFNYPRSAMYGKTTTDNPTELNYNNYGLSPSDYYMNAGLIATLDLCEGIYTSNKYILFAAKDDQIRGLAEVKYISDKPFYYITLFGNKSDEQLNFYLLNRLNGKKYAIANQLLFKSNEINGSYHAPVKLVLTEQIDCGTISKESDKIDVFPSPFDDQVNVAIENFVPQDYSITLYDIQGRTILSVKPQKVNGRANIKIPTSQISSGVYVLEVRSAQSIFTKKIIK